MREGPTGPWAEAEERAEADLRAGRAESVAPVREERMREERKDRQREDRAGTRPYEACKRARQEAYIIPHRPLGFGPPDAPARSAGRKREAPGRIAARQRKLAQRSGPPRPM